KAFKKVCKQVCVFLSVLMIITSIQWQSFIVRAESNTEIETSVEEITNDVNYTSNNPMDLLDIPIVEEVIEKRDAYSKTFRKLDGSYELAIYKERVHYQEEGIWKEINNNLIESVNEYSNKSNLLK